MIETLSNNPSNKTVITKTIQFFWNHSPAIIIIFAIICRLPLVFAPTSYGFQHTDWRQTDTASIAHNFLHNGFNIFYPQVNWGGNGPGYVETEFQLFPFITALLYKIFGEQLWLGMLVSLLFGMASFIIFYAFARKQVSRPVAVLALLFFTVSPLTVRYSVTFMPESIVLFFYLAALYLFNEWLKVGSFNVMILAASSTALAILVKPTSIHIGIIFFLLLWQKYQLSMFRNRQMWLFVIISLLPGILWYLHARNLYLTYGNTFGIISGGDSKFNNLKFWFSPSFYSDLADIDLNWLFTIGGILPFIIGVVVAWRRRLMPLLFTGIFAIIIYYLLIPRYTSFVEYYHIYAVPYAALAVGLGLAWLFEKIELKMSFGHWIRLLVGILMIVLISNSVFRTYRRDTTIYVQKFWECGQEVAKVVPEKALIIVSTTSSSSDNGVPNNYQEPQIFFYSQHYGWSLPSNLHNVSTLKEYQYHGGQYFVIYDKALYQSNKDLIDYLETTAQQVGPGIEAKCAIYKLNNPD